MKSIFFFHLKASKIQKAMRQRQSVHSNNNFLDAMLYKENAREMKSLQVRENYHVYIDILDICRHV